jgi:hypothetical protein
MLAGVWNNTKSAKVTVVPFLVLACDITHNKQHNNDISQPHQSRTLHWKPQFAVGAAFFMINTATSMTKASASPNRAVPATCWLLVLTQDWSPSHARSI